jgi:hypothetical protein
MTSVASGVERLRPRSRSSSAIARAGRKARARRRTAHTNVDEKAPASGPAIAAGAPPDRTGPDGP